VFLSQGGGDWSIGRLTLTALTSTRLRRGEFSTGMWLQPMGVRRHPLQQHDEAQVLLLWIR